MKKGKLDYGLLGVVFLLVLFFSLYLVGKIGEYFETYEIMLLMSGVCVGIIIEYVFGGVRK